MFALKCQPKRTSRKLGCCFFSNKSLFKINVWKTTINRSIFLKEQPLQEASVHKYDYLARIKLKPIFKAHTVCVETRRKIVQVVQNNLY